MMHLCITQCTYWTPLAMSSYAHAQTQTHPHPHTHTHTATYPATHKHQYFTNIQAYIILAPTHKKLHPQLTQTEMHSNIDLHAYIHMHINCMHIHADMHAYIF